MMVHTGKAVEFERDQLPAEIIRPESAGARWRGVAHSDFAHEIVTGLERRGVEVTGDRWATMSENQVLIGSLDVVPPDVEGIPGQKFSLGVTHSNNMTKSMRITVGTTVLVCDNGVMTGEYVLKRKHTIGMNLRVEIRESLRRAVNQFEDTQRIVNGLRDRTMGELEVDHNFMEIGRRGILSWSQIGKALREYNAPEHPEFLEYKGTAWGVYQAANHIVKERSPLSQMQSLKGLTELLAAA